MKIKNRVEDYLGITIDYNRDALLKEKAKKMLTTKGFYKRSNEDSPQQTLARGSTCYSFGDYEFAQRIYEYSSKGYFTFASPVLSTAMEVDWPTFNKDEFEVAGDWLEENVTPEGLPISCFLSHIPDNKVGLVEGRKETAWLSMMGGGIGIGMNNRSPDEKSTGVMAHLRGYDADALAYKQTSSRRGSIAAYLDIDHPEIKNFISCRNPVGGDSNKKCFNLNNAVCITDSFMEKVIKGEKYELVDPKHGATGTFLDAREVMEDINQQRYETGEPYIMFKDTVNRGIPKWITKPTYHVSQSNLCVAPDTFILTDKGHIQIGDLENETVNVWNGEQFSETTVIKTSESSSLFRVGLNSGQELDCTEYHKFYVQEDYGKDPVMKSYNELKIGDKLIKSKFPVIQGDKFLTNAYQNGFYTGDGCEVKGKSRVYFYGEKKELEAWFDLEQRVDQPQYDRVYGNCSGLMPKFFVPSSEYSVDIRLTWLAGLLDADGTVARNGDNESLQLASINKDFLLEVQLMLQTLGVNSKVCFARKEGKYLLPANDGTGGLKEYNCSETNRLLISSTGLYQLTSLGLDCVRLKWENKKPQRCAEQFSKVIFLQDLETKSSTYCFKEELRGMGIFNGILTGQCSEITLMTSEKRTAVCCLSSLNLDKYDEWKDTTIVEDLVRLLDNVLEYFIRLAPKELYRAVHSASQERAIGLGNLGFHSFLQRKNIPFESGGFNSASQWAHILTSTIQERAIASSKVLAEERGEPEDCIGSGMRNSHLTATAPNASSSDFVGVSPSIEPWSSNAINTEGRAGSYLIKNPHLEDVLEKLGLNTDEMWDSIIKNNGSVQHRDDLSGEIKKVYKTASEIDPMWVVELAALRQPNICQAQSLNIFVTANITKEKMMDVVIAAWKKGVKTLYYCRAEQASKTNIGKGDKAPLNSIPVESTFKVDIEECLSCHG